MLFGNASFAMCQGNALPSCVGFLWPCKMAIIEKPHVNFGIVKNFLNNGFLYIF